MTKKTRHLSDTAEKHQQGTINALDIEYVNETHVADFIEALNQDLINGTPDQTSVDNPEYISAWTDALPVRSAAIPARKSRRLRRKLKEQEAAKPKGISHSLLQWPLIIGIGMIMAFELLCYFLIRQVVRIWENLVSWRGQKKLLRDRLRASKSYEEWCEAAERLDKYMHKDEWKQSIPDAYYDYRLLDKVVKHLKKYRQGNTAEDATKLMDVLYVCLKQNFAGIENSKLYSTTYLGTKALVEEYVDEVTRSIESISTNEFIPAEEKRLAFKLYSKNYGRTAFCLSGGAGFGYYHLGVLRALLDRGLLPSIITGTSAGSLMGAIVCSRTDEELDEILRPELAQRINICAGSWGTRLKSLATTGALFDATAWCKEAMWFCKGSVTFKEAYERTGRIFNVSVIPYDAHSPPKLLNYITAPDCVIWSAVLASAAIPGILTPVVLMQKKPGSEHLIPYNYGHRFKDGSLRTDIPTFALNTQFNVNYTVVSQVNPHVHVFFYANQGSPGRPVTHLQGRGWRGGFLASSIEQILKLDLAKWLKVLRDLKLLPNLHDQDWSSVFLQKFDGNVTILPKSNLSDWFHLLSDPDEDRLKQLMLSAQIRTWPKVSMISNRLRIESAIEKAKKSLRQSSKQDYSVTNKDFSRITSLPMEELAAEINAGNTSDVGSGDEIKFLSRRRLSMPDAALSSHNVQKEFYKEQNRRRRFMAQFTESAKKRMQEAIFDNLVSSSDDESNSSPSPPELNN
ncbi:acyl transferase/acyl hydrolase/lysophospholipase [Pilobolus umbonatus]|nr:acyl transferase/acyl hydrolase/lysophospholipase [Pilobolus umbonatus]